LSAKAKNYPLSRSGQDYGRGFSKKGAAATIKCAEAFLKAARKILRVKPK